MVEIEFLLRHKSQVESCFSGNFQARQEEILKTDKFKTNSSKMIFLEKPNFKCLHLFYKKKNINLKIRKAEQTSK